MWYEEYTDKHGQLKYRFYEKYKDPYTDKWRRVCVNMNKKGKQSQKEAQRRLNERIEAKIKDKTPSNIKTLTFHQLCDEWLDTYIKTSGAKQSTIDLKRYNIKFIKKYIPKDVLVKNINNVILQKFIDEAHKKVTYSYLMLNWGFIKSILKYATNHYNVSNINYIDKVIIPKKAKSREEIKAKRENYLEKHEIDKLVENIYNSIDETDVKANKQNLLMTSYIVEFLALNGMRVGELLAIQPKNIDFKNKTLEIDGTIYWTKQGNGYGIKDTTKTESSYRTISLTSRSCDILKKAMLQNKKLAQWEPKYNDRGFIFTNIKGNPLHTVSINKIVQKSAKNVGIKKHISSHSMRHSHISMLSQLGVSLKAIMERVGHTDHKTTLKIYSHVTEQMDKDMMNKLEKISK